MDELDKFKSNIMKKIAYHFLKSTIAEMNIQSLDVEFKDEDVEISVQGNLTIPREELIKLIWRA